jgi:hypothetical protein
MRTLLYGGRVSTNPTAAAVAKKYGVTLPAEYERFLADETYKTCDASYPGSIPFFAATDQGPRIFFLVGDDVPAHPKGKGYVAGRGRAELFPDVDAASYIPFAALVNPEDDLMDVFLAIDVSGGDKAPVFLFWDGEFLPMADSIGDVISNLRQGGAPAPAEVLAAAVEKARELIEAEDYAKALATLGPAIAPFADKTPGEEQSGLRFDLVAAYQQQGRAEKFSGDQKGAEASFLRAKALYPENYGSTMLLAWLYYDTDRFADVIKEAEPAIGPASGDNKFEMEKALVLSYLALGRNDDAEKIVTPLAELVAQGKYPLFKKQGKELQGELDGFAKKHPDRAEAALAFHAALGNAKTKKKEAKATKAAPAKAAKAAKKPASKAKPAAKKPAAKPAKAKPKKKK